MSQQCYSILYINLLARPQIIAGASIKRPGRLFKKYHFWPGVGARKQVTSHLIVPQGQLETRMVITFLLTVKMFDAAHKTG